jgi:signal transduction histidine kinase
MMMNLDVARSQIAMNGEPGGTWDAVVRATRKLQSWFNVPDREQWQRELNVRLEERLKERARIARELHDTLFQGFIGASMQLHNAVEQVPADSPCKHSLCRTLVLMQRVIDEGRDTLNGLRSNVIASMSLEQALAGLRDEIAPCSGVPFRIFVTGKPKMLDPGVQEQVFHIGREALINALRHSEATEIEAELEYLPRRFRLVVRDNGRGIDPRILRSGRDSHWGLAGMRERAGSVGAQLRIMSGQGAGTEVEISVPGHVMAQACA